MARYAKSQGKGPKKQKNKDKLKASTRYLKMTHGDGQVTHSFKGEKDGKGTHTDYEVNMKTGKSKSKTTKSAKSAYPDKKDTGPDNFAASKQTQIKKHGKKKGTKNYHKDKNHVLGLRRKYKGK